MQKYASRPSLGPNYAEVIGPWHIQNATLGEGYKSPDTGRSLGADMRGACADGRGHARICAVHVRMLARWLREFEFEWDFETRECCV